MSEDMSVYNELRLRKQLCDAVIRVDGVEFHVHKVILCSCSPYFRALFSHWSTPDCQIYDIHGVTAELMKVIVEFAYTGFVPVTQDNAQELFTAADRFNIMGILEACGDFIEQELSPQNCIGIWLFAETYYYPGLREKAFLFTLNHFEEVVATSEEFLSLPTEHLYEIVQSDQLSVKQEETVYEAILKWIAFAPEERKEYVCVLLSNVRLALISPKYIIKNVIENEFVKSSPEYRATVLETLNLIVDHMSKNFSKSLLCHSFARPRLPSSILLAVGGWTDGSPTNIIEAYDPRTDLWIRMDYPEHIRRAYHGAVFLNKSVYCVGGFDSVERFSTVHRFDLATHTWHEVSPMHSSRCFVSVTVMDEYIYAMGGYNGHSRLETAERYEPRSNQWTLIASMHEQRSDASSATLQNRVYICGGFNGRQCLSTAECYNPNTDQWTLITSMNSMRSGVGVIAYANRIFAVGGFDGSRRLATAEAYSPSTNTWDTVLSMKIPRSNFGISVIDDCLFVVGGYNGSTTASEVEYYDEKTNGWSDASNMEISRSALSCCVVHGLSTMANNAVLPFFHFPQMLDEEEEEMEA
ncbi:kelch-like protein 10 [Kryptolebias marmoratus]|uniref:Kelch like family member 10 n=1 Tax=Kryptolebias marmoratus TaxID=37003 RepID=A0A3Q3AYP5_KRYMA|nr:kelch-like protein 10 [Kryptolebias marmoratus]